MRTPGTTENRRRKDYQYIGLYKMPKDKITLKFFMNVRGVSKKITPCELENWSKF